jgi:hypothetical protein
MQSDNILPSPRPPLPDAQAPRRRDFRLPAKRERRVRNDAQDLPKIDAPSYSSDPAAWYRQADPSLALAFFRLWELIRADVAEAELIELTIGQLMQFTTMWL